MLNLDARTRKMLNIRKLDDSYFKEDRRGKARRIFSLGDKLNGSTITTVIEALKECPKDATFNVNYYDDDGYSEVECFIQWYEPETDEEFVKRVIREDDVKVQLKKQYDSQQKKELELLAKLKKKYEKD